MAPFFTPPHKKPASSSTYSSYSSSNGGNSSTFGRVKTGSNSANNNSSSTLSSGNPLISRPNTATLAPTSFRRDLLAPSASASGSGSATAFGPASATAATFDRQANRNSRVDLDFESALAAHDTFKLHEGRDLTTIGMGTSPDTPNFLAPTSSRTTQDSHDSTVTVSSTSTVGNAHEPSSPGPRRLRKPNHGTPTSPVFHRRSGDTAEGRLSISSIGPESPTPVKREFPPRDGEDGFRDETKKRSMFRSAGTASTPDLATLKRKKDGRSQFPQSPEDETYGTDVTPGTMSNWTANLATRSRAQSTKDSGKAQKTLRSKTGTFLSKVFSSNAPGTLRDRNYESSPKTPTRDPYNHRFQDSPPVPTVPREYRGVPTSTIDMNAPPPSPSPLSPSTSGRHERKASKPLPPIKRPISNDVTPHMNISPVDNSSQSSNSPHLQAGHPTSGDSTPSPSGSTRRPEVTARHIGHGGSSRRRSMSVGDVEQWHKRLEGTGPKPRNNRAVSSQTIQSEKSDKTATPTSEDYATATVKGKGSANSTPMTTASKEWETALLGFDRQMASLEIKDPTSRPLLPSSKAPLLPPVKIRPRSRSQNPIPTNTIDLGSDTGEILSVRHSVVPVSSPASPSSSQYGTPNTGLTPTSPTFSATSSTPRRPVSASKITDTYTTSTSPRTVIAPSAASSGQSSPVTPQSAAMSQSSQAASSALRRSSSSNRSESPQHNPVSPRGTTSLRVASLRSTQRPTIGNLGTPPSAIDAGTLRPPGRADSSPATMHTGGPKISLSLTSPSQENLRHSELGRVKYSSRSPASNSEPALVPAAEESVKTIRLITSTSRMSGGGRDGRDTYESEFGTRLSSPSSSAKHTFSVSGSGTSVGRSSVGERNSRVDLTVPTDPEELESKGEAIAERIWEEDESFKARDRFSEWLGKDDPLSAVARKYYMDHFDFSNLRVDAAFRRLCGKLYLRGESQVIDRILIEFSRRYWELNTSCVLGSSSNVHQVVYSLLLLNTDLHVADLASHMTKQQFISNTMGTLTAASRISSSVPTPARSGSPVLGQSSDSLARKPSMEPVSATADKGDKAGPPISIQNASMRDKRSNSVSSWKGSLTRGGSDVTSGAVTGNSSLNGSTISIHETNSPSVSRKHSSNQGSVSSLPLGFGGGNKAWESEVETYLKNVYDAIRKDQILQPLGIGGGLSPGNTLGRRTSSRRGNNNFVMKRNSFLQSFVNPQGINASTSSVDGRVSPSPSYSTSSINESLPATAPIVAPPPGFAYNLAQTIIKEAQEDDVRSIKSGQSDSTDVSISDEELALLGAPWAKEGMLNRKQFMDSTGKKTKKSNWMDVFVVIQKGRLSMFVFGASGGGSSSRSQQAVVGGGNWAHNATNVGDFMLAHSLSNILPPPGLARHPHCFVLTLSSGMQFFFQAGTDDLANEWVSTCNYWAARQSKEPLAGGVSNMEYGWNRVRQDLETDDSTDGDTSGSFDINRVMSRDGASDNFSLKSGRSRIGVRFDGFTTMRANMGPSSSYADRIYINDWRPPGHSTIASTHDEETQLEALEKQAAKLKTELKEHNDLREPMVALYAPRSANLAKALMNWESRSQYLLAESYKYDTYVDSLKNAMKERLKRRGEKALEKALSSSNSNTSGANRGFGLTVTDVDPNSELTSDDHETDTESATPGPARTQFE